MNFFKISLFSLCFSLTPCFSFIYRVKHLRSQDGSQNIFLFSDDHAAKLGSAQQRVDLLEILSKFSREPGTFQTIVEDMLSIDEVKNIVEQRLALEEQVNIMDQNISFFGGLKDGLDQQIRETNRLLVEQSARKSCWFLSCLTACFCRQNVQKIGLLEGALRDQLDGLEKQKSDLCHKHSELIAMRKAVFDEIGSILLSFGMPKDFYSAVYADYLSHVFDFNKDYSCHVPHDFCQIMQKQQSAKSPLSYLSQVCRKHNIPVYNCECRLPVSNLHILPQDFIRYYRSVSGEIEFLFNLPIVQVLSDKSFFLKEYGQLRLDFKRAVELFDPNLPMSTGFSNDREWHESIENKFFNGMRQAKLVDFMILGNLLKNRDKKNICIYAGGAHIAAVSNILASDFNYTVVNDTAASNKLILSIDSGFLPWGIDKDLEPIQLSSIYSWFF